MKDTDLKTELLSGVLKVTKDEVERGLELHRKFVVVDGSCDSPAIWTEEMRKNALRLIEKKGTTIPSCQRINHLC